MASLFKIYQAFKGKKNYSKLMQTIPEMGKKKKTLYSRMRWELLLFSSDNINKENLWLPIPHEFRMNFIILFGTLLVAVILYLPSQVKRDAPG